MRFQNVSINGLAYVDAPHRITSTSVSDQLAPMLQKFDIRHGLLEEITGIVARRFWDDGLVPSDVAAMAGEKAIAASGVKKEEIGILINTSVCRDYLEPSTASLVHSKMGMSPDCMNFDVGNACLAFMNGMAIAGNMIERGQINHALIVDGEGSRYIYGKTIERLLGPEATPKTFRDNFATLTLGSGSVAMVLSRADLAPEGHKVLGAVNVAATEHAKLCHGTAEEMITDAKTLLFAGLGLAQQTWEKATEYFGWSDDIIKEYVIHQVSATHTNTLAAQLGLTREKIFTIFEEFGNIGPAGVPTVLAKTVEAGRVQKGDRVALLGIGSGLNCSMMDVQW